jgi:SAM-dependent methyltransferase
VKRILRFFFYCLYYPASRIFLKLEHFTSWKEFHSWIDNTPKGIFTGAGFDSYTNWMRQQGFMSATICCFFDRYNLKVVDFGCGMGKYAPVCEIFTAEGGKYLGVDTDIVAIKECHKIYRNLKNCEFYLTKDQNAFYKNPGATHIDKSQIDWPVANASQDLLISISVFTHLQEAESFKYMSKIHEILVPGGIAIISFHIVRDYVNSNPMFNFTIPLTSGWFTSDRECPEHAIAIDVPTVHKLIKDKFTILKWLEGTSTGGKSPSFQDLFILKKI